MKHKTLTSLFALASGLCLCLGLAACGEEPKAPSENPDTGTPQHTYTAENVCSDCGEKWEFTEGLEYELDGDAYTVTGIGTASGDIVIPYGHEGKFVTKIADGAFCGSEAVTGIFVPEKIVSVGGAAFAECPNLINATWDAANCTKAGITVEEFEDSELETLDPFDYLIFANSGLKTLTIGEHVKKIPDAAFAFCTAIKTVVIPDGVTSVGGAVFANCNLLESITIGKGVTSIGQSTCAACNKLTNVQWNAENCTIAKLSDDALNVAYVFDLLDSLKTITFGDSVKTIPAQFVYQCSSLESVTFGKNVVSVGEHAFNYCEKLESVHIADLAAWCKIEFADVDAYPLNYRGGRLYLGETEIKELVIPEGITEIKSKTFLDCYGLTSVKIPDSVTVIGNEAFSGCGGLSSIEIPDSVTVIGNEAFRGCSGLSSIEIPDSVTSIGDGTFQSCEGLESVTFGNGVTSIGSEAFSSCTSLTSISISDGVNSIEYGTFAYCTSLTSITIPRNVTAIGNLAFFNCSELTDIQFKGTVEQWQTIEKRSSWDSNADYTVTCTNGTVAKDGTVTHS